MNTYIWKHKAEDGVIELYAGKTYRTAEQRIKPMAYTGPKSRPIAAGQVEIIHEDCHAGLSETQDKIAKEEGITTKSAIVLMRFNNDICSAEQLLIDTIKAIQKLYPNKVRVLNSRRGFSASSAGFQKRWHNKYKDKNSEGLDFFPQLLSKIIKEL